MAEVANEISAYNDPTQAAILSAKAAAAVGVRSPGSGGGQGGLLEDPVMQYLLRNVRSKHVRQHFAKTPATEYTQPKEVTVMTASFNVNGKKPPPGVRLDEWLGSRVDGKWVPPHGPGSDGTAPSEAPDIVAVGFQEIVPLNAGNVIGVSGSENVAAWDRALAAHLNGEAWAAAQYGPSAVAGQAAAAIMEQKWQGGPVSAAAAGAAAAGAAGGGGEYAQVASRQMVGLYLSVWVRRGLLPAVKGCQVTAVATGFGGYLGNKGAVAARLRVYDSSMAFLVAHLSSGDKEGDEAYRNSDVADILRRCVFAATQPDGSGGLAMTSTSAQLNSALLGSGHWRADGPMGLYEHDLVVWMGDLNYRLVPSAMSDADARAHIRAGRVEPLLAADQLRREVLAGRVFQGWHEGAIHFMPTFKFKVGTHAYLGDEASAMVLQGAAGSLSQAQMQRLPPDAPSTQSSGLLAAGEDEGGVEEKQKRRMPAWCDRVLWCCPGQPRRGPGLNQQHGPTLRQHGYWRGELALSDHKPVAAVFSADVVAYDRKRIEALLEAALRDVERMQQSLRPKVSVDPVVLVAGRVAHAVPKRLEVTLTNEGQVEAMFHFVPPPSTTSSGKFGLDDETPPLPAWLSAEPAEGVLEPGQSRKLALTVLVDGGLGGAAVALLGPEGAAAGPRPLDAIIILRIEDSGDKFITVTGEYVPSFIGMPHNNLAALGPSPVLSMQDADATSLGVEPEHLMQGWQPFDQEPAQHTAAGAEDTVPKEVAQLLDALQSSPGVLQTPGIFVDSCRQLLAGSQGSSTAPPGPADAQQQPTSRREQRELLQRLTPLRLCLDLGRKLPASAVPHELAALLLLWAGQLPQPLLPQAVADAVAIAPPASAAIAGRLLADECDALQLAAVRAQLRVLRSALEPEAAARNGLSANTLAAALTQWWLPPLGAGASSDAAANRTALLEQLLDLRNPEVL